MSLKAKENRPSSGQQSLGRELLAAERAAAVQNDTAVLGCHTRTETVTTGTHELGGLVSTLHDIRPRECTVPLVWCCLKAEGGDG